MAVLRNVSASKWNWRLFCISGLVLRTEKISCAVQSVSSEPSEVKLHNNDDDDRNYTFLMQKSFANDLRNSTEMQNKRQIHFADT